VTGQQTLAALELGSPAPDFALPATDGRRYDLAAFQEQSLLTVIFSANHCPYVAAWEDRIIALAAEFSGRGVGFALISSMDASKYPQDSFEEMVKRARDKNYPFPYLYDETQVVARAFGATRTPEVFVFDKERRLRYHGAVDSDFEEGQDREHYLRDALTALLAGEPVAVPETPPLGCRLTLK
jgi:peroxiredoxin